jgi:hypothetical protein
LDGIVKLTSVVADGSSVIGTGTLLSDGRHILTAAHVLTDSDGNIAEASTKIEFFLPFPGEPDVPVPYENVPASSFHIHPGWHGTSSILVPDNDLAIIDLPSLAPPGAEGRDIYRGTDEVGQTFQVVGYGKTGTGDTGDTIADHEKRQGLNVFDTADDGKLEFLFRRVANQVFVAHGDSGGPDLVDGKIAGVNSMIRETFGEPDSTFGERAFSTRVSAYADWIDAQTTGVHPLVLDMHQRADEGDGIRDRIDVRVAGGNLEIRVNGQLFHSEAAANVSSLKIIGSNDSEDIVIAGPLGMDVSVDAGIASITDNVPQSLTVLGTAGPDTVKVGPDTVTLGGNTITFKNVQLTVDTLGGNDTLIGPDSPNQWSLKGTNGGTLSSLVTFTNVENLQGGTAADAFSVGLGASLSGRLNGGGGGDSLTYPAFTTPVTINLQLGTATAIGGGISNFTSVFGGFSDANTLIGRNQSTLWNLTGINAGQMISGGNTLAYSGFENLQGGTASDTFRISNAGGVTGSLDGGKGVPVPGGITMDTLDYSLRTTGVVVDLTRGLIPGAPKAFGIEGVIGTPKDDLLRGDARDNVLQGGGGFDILIGMDGKDKLVAGSTGRCILIGGRGQDMLVGGNPYTNPLVGRPVSDGSDLLIGGMTSFDQDNQALTAILTEWRRTDRTYAQRVQDLRTGVPVGTGAVARLTTATVLDDGVADQIAGQGGDDWFWGLATEVADRSKLISQPGTLELIN